MPFTMDEGEQIENMVERAVAKIPTTNPSLGPWSMSEKIDLLATSMALCQGEIKGATKDSVNPFFRSKYADLASIWDAIREPMAKYGLSLVQLPSSDRESITVHSILLHKSGQWMQGQLTLYPVKTIKVRQSEGPDISKEIPWLDPQGMGSAITYARRYHAAAIFGVAPEDDDANAASNKGQGETLETKAKNSQEEERQKTQQTGTPAPNRKTLEPLAWHKGTLFSFAIKNGKTNNKAWKKRMFVFNVDGHGNFPISCLHLPEGWDEEILAEYAKSSNRISFKWKLNEGGYKELCALDTPTPEQPS